MKDEHRQANSLQSQLVNKDIIIKDLPNALTQEQLVLYFQPQVNIKTGKIIGNEALLRWEHPQYGTIYPNDFLPLAEKMDLRLPITEWVLQQACAQNKAWQEDGRPVTVAINISSHEFYHIDLVTIVQQTLDQHQLDAHCLELEITEHTVLDIPRVMPILEQLKQIGLRISMDDFGTGHSSLFYLKRFPLDKLKIDNSFMEHCTADLQDATLVETIISLAHSLRLECIAEGVETKAQYTFLQERLCEEAQGYYICPPLPPEQLARVWKDIERRMNNYRLPPEKQKKYHLRKELQETKRDLQTTIRFHQGMIFKYTKIDGKFIHTLCDGQLLIQIGWSPEDVVGKTIDQLIPNNPAQRVQHFYERAWRGEENIEYEITIHKVTLSTSLRPVWRHGKVTEVIGSCMDITKRKRMGEELYASLQERKKTEELLHRTDKLLTVGQLAAGVAHEIRNPLTAIKGFIQLMEKDSPHSSYFPIIYEEFDRVETIIHEFLSLAKPQEENQSLESLNKIVSDVIQLFRSACVLRNIQIDSNLHDQLPLIRCRPNQLKQVFVNLFQNSVDAMSGGGRLFICTATKNLHEKEVIVIRIEDNGPGIEPSRIKRLGEPFYSTKEKGTGLGLMICHKIIDDHNGTIEFQSIVGNGTTVEVYLPFSSRRNRLC